MKKRVSRKAQVLSVLLILALLFGNGTNINAAEYPEATSTEVSNEVSDEGSEEDTTEVPTTMEVKPLQEPAVASKALTGVGMTVELQVDGYEDTLVEQVRVTLPDTYKSLKEYGLSILDANDPGFYTPLHALAQYCQDTYQDVTRMEVAPDGYLRDFMGDTGAYPSTGYMFVINDTYQMMPGYNYGYGLNQYPLSDGERITIYNSWYVYNTTAPMNGNYAWFSEKEIKTEQNNPSTITLNTISSFTGVRTNPAKADILLLNQDGTELEKTKYTTAKTSNNGTAVVTVYEPGTYRITAKRTADYYLLNGDNPYDISHPYSTIEVAASTKPINDAEAVVKAKESLVLGKIEGITSDITLPSTWSYNTSVTWSSSHPKALSNQGKVPVLRPVGQDTSVTLVATITKGSASQTKSFSATVKGISLLLKTLTVSAGGLEFDAQKKEYTVYVKEDETKIGISGSLLEDVYTGLSFWVHNGKKEIEIKKDVEKNWSTVEVTLPKATDTMVIPVKVKMYYPAHEAITTITVKRAKNPQPSLPELPDNIWGGHLGTPGNNATTNVETPKKEGALAWESFAEGKDSWGTWYAGSPIIINNKMYVARNNQIQMLDLATGKAEKSTNLLYELGFSSYITYGGGKIFVPLGNGAVQCFQGSTLESLFVTKIPTLPFMSLQAPNAIHFSDGMIYVGYSNGAFTDKAAAGYFAGYSVADLDIENATEVITPQWTYEQKKTNYYGMGAVTVHKGKSTFLVFGGDDGRLISVNPKTGKELDVMKLDGKIRCGIVNAEEYLWLTTQAGKLYRIGVSSSGIFEEKKEAELPERLSTNSSPVIADGKLYVTGGGWNKGFLAVYDQELQLLAKEFTKAQANTPTVSTADGEIYVYFTLNEEAGALYAAHVTKNNQVSITTLYTPKHSQYSMSNVVVGADGTVYYGNDAGYLFAVKAGVVVKPDEKPEEKPEQKPEQKPDKAPEQDTEKKEITSTTKTYMQTRLMPRKAKITEDGKKHQAKTKSESVADAIRNNMEKGKKTLTIRELPKKLDAVVFETLKEYKEMQLILDCGAYTLSIRGADVIRTDASLQTELIRKTSTNQAEQRMEFPQEGALPGAVIVVYPLSKQLQGAKELYLQLEETEADAQQVTIQDGYTMFVLEEGGTYLLSESKGKIVMSSTVQRKIDPNKIPKEAGVVMLSKIKAYAKVAGILAIGILLGGVIQSKRRRRRDVWEAEQ